MLTALEGAGHAYKIVAPVMTSGWAFLGESDKLTPVSVQRNWTLKPSPEALLVTMTGASGETCTLIAWKGGVTHRQVIVLDDQGLGVVTFKSPIRRGDV